MQPASGQPQPAIARSWWLAPPGPLRRLQMTVLLLAALSLVAVAGWAMAGLAGASGNEAWTIGAAIAVALEVALLAVRVRVHSERSVELPGDPATVYAVATDPQGIAQRSPMNLKLGPVSGRPGTAGSTYQSSSSGLAMRTRVVEADPPRRIVTETRSRLSRAVIERRYTPTGNGTRVEITSTLHMPAVAWLARPLYAREIRSTLAETERRLRQAVIDQQGPAS